MGLFGDIAGAVSNSGFGQKVIKVARDIKKVAGSVTKAIAGKEGIIATAYGKIKSFGSMVIDRVFPSADPDEIEALQSVTSSAQQAGGTEFVKNFSGALKSASPGPVGAPPQSITESVKQSYSYLGGNIEDATSRIYDNTIEAMGKPVKPGTDLGKTIAEKSRVAVSVLQKPAVPKSGFITSSEIYDPASTRGIQDLIGKPALPLNLQSQPLNVQYQSALDAGMDARIVEQSRELGISPYAGIAKEITKSGVVGSGATQKDLLSAGLEQDKMVKPGDVSNITDKKPSLFDKAIEAAKNNSGALADKLATGFSTFGEMEPYVAPTSGSAPSMIGSQRGGIGGKGSAGGEFLTEAQRAFINQQRSLLERIG